MTRVGRWAQAEQVHWKIQPFVDGRYLASHARESVENINPANEQPLCRFSTGDSLDVDLAVQVARRRYKDRCWSGLTPTRRSEVLLRFGELVSRRKNDLALLDTLEMGKPISASLFDVEIFAPSLLRSWASCTDQLVGEAGPVRAGTLSFSTFEPRGVVGAITPWNFPVVNAIFKIGPALGAGNCVVLKPSEIAPSSALKLAELALEAGVPDGVFNVVPGLGSTVGASLVAHSGVDMLTFTGSSATGQRIMELAGRGKTKPLLLECGGKSPQIVFGDVADLDAAADAIVQSALWNQGQVCSARTRLIAHSCIKEELLAKVISRAERYCPGDPLDDTTTFGPLASPTQRNRVKNYIEEGLRAGAEAVLRGRVQETGGCNVAPTIFDRVDSRMSIAREEIFGPVLCVQLFETEEEAVALANDSEYGLEATVWTRDIDRAKRLARDLETGLVSIRTGTDEAGDCGLQLGWEPRKASGFGVEAGLKGLESYSARKLVNIGGP